jgi:ABC-type transport system involved in cytochrome c biogenesis permease subunit
MMALIALFLIAGALGVQSVFLLLRASRRDPASHFGLLAAAALLLATTVHRSIQIRFVAVTNTFESLVFFSAVICILVFVFRLAMKDRLPAFLGFGATAIALVLLLIANSPLASREIQPPIPALQSYWLVLHVAFAFIGESFFAVSFVAAIMYLAAKSEERRNVLDRIVYTTIGIGYPIFTAGALVFGAIWAEVAWGSYWSWDPKETWALITWLVYTAYLHSRLVRKLRGRISALLAVVGFAFTLFTFFGVNYLLGGLHSYA